MSSSPITIREARRGAPVEIGAVRMQPFPVSEVVWSSPVEEVIAPFLAGINCVPEYDVRGIRFRDLDLGSRTIRVVDYWIAVYA